MKKTTITQHTLELFCPFTGISVDEKAAYIIGEWFLDHENFDNKHPKDTGIIKGSKEIEKAWAKKYKDSKCTTVKKLEKAIDSFIHNLKNEEAICIKVVVNGNADQINWFIFEDK